MVIDGSWNINSYVGITGFKVGFAPLPTGPHGRKSMFNSVADSIWSGSGKKGEALKWVEFLGSSECQNIVAESGAVFPARVESFELALQKWAARGVKVSAFTDLEDSETFFFPAVSQSFEVETFLDSAMNSIETGAVGSSKALAIAAKQIRNIGR